MLSSPFFLTLIFSLFKSKLWVLTESMIYCVFLIYFLKIYCWSLLQPHLEPNPSKLRHRWALFSHSLTRFLALYHLCASVHQGSSPGFPFDWQRISLGTFFSSQTSFMDSAAYVTCWCFFWSPLVSCFCLSVKKKTKKHKCTADRNPDYLKKSDWVLRSFRDAGGLLLFFLNLKRFIDSNI